MTIANAVLTAITANTIQGTAPVFDNSGTARDALGFKLGGTIYSERNTNLSETNTNYFPEDKTLNDFIVPSAIDLFNTTTDYSDTDIDVASITTLFTGNIIFTWTDNGGLPVTSSSSTLLGNICTGTKNYDFPLTLTITANVSASSEYGDLKTSTPKPLSKPYKIDMNEYKICNFKTASMNINNDISECGTTADGTTPSSNGNCKWEGGYNPAIFDPVKSFIGSTNFPITAFDKAKFTLLMTNAQTDYTYSSNNSIVNVSNISGSEGEVTFSSSTRPTLPFTVILTATTKPGVVTPPQTVTHTFTIDKWARNKGEQYFNTGTDLIGAYNAANACGGLVSIGAANRSIAESYFFTRVELTNSPYSDPVTYPPLTSDKTGVYGSRDADGTFFVEWGALSTCSLITASDYMWTAEGLAYVSHSRQYTMDHIGMIHQSYTSNLGNHIAICKK